MSSPFRRALFARPSFSTSSSSSSENYQKAILEFERIASESSTPLGKAVKARANLLDAVTKHKQNLFDYGHTKKEKMNMEPMEGFAIPSRAGTVFKPVTQTPEIDKPDPLAMPAPFAQSTTRLLTEPDGPLSADPAPLLQPVDESHLILRAIFGVGRDLNRDEILKKASELPGIMSVKLLGRAERAALRVLRDGIQDLGVSLDLISKDASVDLIHGEATTLVVFYEGEFRPGVREILTIVARQFSEID